MQVVDRLEVCPLCLSLLANGTVEDDGREVTAEHAARMRQVWGDQLRNMMPACPEDCDGSFSWSSCEGCGGLPGERHPAVVLGPDAGA